MAQVTGTTDGLVVEEITDLETMADDLDPISVKVLDAFKCLQRQNQHKAAAAHLVDAVNALAAEYDLSCGAAL